MESPDVSGATKIWLVERRPSRARRTVFNPARPSARSGSNAKASFASPARVTEKPRPSALLYPTLKTTRRTSTFPFLQKPSISFATTSAGRYLTSLGKFSHTTRVSPENRSPMFGRSSRPIATTRVNRMPHRMHTTPYPHPVSENT